ncbi:MAG: membrane associated rhomboid family serine protease [Saprospiraceae bacterium]|jgi:membrane associated rhomboid family serine protease
MSTFLNDIKQKYRDGNMLIKVIFVNVGVYFAFVLLNVVSPLIVGDQGLNIVQEYLYPYLALHSNLSDILFKPWTLITHQFVHELDIWHLVGNMFLLYFLGGMFLNYFSQKQLFGLYLLGGLMGAAVLVVVTNISPYFTAEISAVGASAAVMAIAIAVCSYAPKNQVFLFGVFKVQLQWIGLFLLVSDLIFFYDGNTGGHIAHLGGAATGYWFASSIKKGKDITTTINKIITFFGQIPNIFKKKSKLKVAHSNIRSMTDDQYNELRQATQADIDSILDKIGKNGYECLSKKEKEMLFKFSKK